MFGEPQLGAMSDISCEDLRYFMNLATFRIKEFANKTADKGLDVLKRDIDAKIYIPKGNPAPSSTEHCLTLAGKLTMTPTEKSYPACMAHLFANFDVCRLYTCNSVRVTLKVIESSSSSCSLSEIDSPYFYI